MDFLLPSAVSFYFTVLFPRKIGYRKKVYRPVLGREVAQRVLIHGSGLGWGFALCPGPIAAEGRSSAQRGHLDGETPLGCRGLCVCKELTFHLKPLKVLALYRSCNEPWWSSRPRSSSAPFPRGVEEADCGAHAHLAQGCTLEEPIKCSECWLHGRHEPSSTKPGGQKMS